MPSLFVVLCNDDVIPRGRSLDEDDISDSLLGTELGTVLRAGLRESGLGLGLKLRLLRELKDDREPQPVPSDPSTCLKIGTVRRVGLSCLLLGVLPLRGEEVFSPTLLGLTILDP